jgi:anti-sigma factor RsiW
MKCTQARRLFGAYWDDETTQAEREWVESHLAACPACRLEYETFSRAVELTGSLPRLEAAPDLVERVLARARRAAPAPDRFPAASRPWVPATAAAALLVIAISFAVPWLGVAPRVGRAPATLQTVRIPAPVSGTAPQLEPRHLPAGPSPAANGEPRLAASVTTPADSLFDHSEDVEFILDPVTLHRGRATVTRQPGGVQGEKAVISF